MLTDVLRKETCGHVDTPPPTHTQREDCRKRHGEIILHKASEEGGGGPAVVLWRCSEVTTLILTRQPPEQLGDDSSPMQGTQSLVPHYGTLTK